MIKSSKWLFTNVFIIICFFVIDSFASPKNDDELENPNFSQRMKSIDINESFKLSETIKNFSSELNNLSPLDHHPIEDYIKKFLNKFQDIQASEFEWKKLASSLNTYKWPTQKTWKEAVGASLFFPSHQLHKWLEIPETSDLAERTDMLWRYAAATRLKHPLGAFYLARSFYKLVDPMDDIEDEETPKDRCKMIAKKFLSHAFENLLLNQVLDHGQPDATYAVGQGLISPSFGALKKYLGKLSEEEFFTRGNDFKNQLSFLKKRRKFIKYEKPSVEEILSLARKGYLPTYLEAYIYAKSLKLPDQGESILNEALEHEYIPALLYKAYLYQDKKDFDHARECYNFFAEAGYFKGYTKLAELNIGDVQKSYQKLQGMTEDQRHFVTDLYMRAAHPNNPEGFLELGKHLVILAKYFSADNQEQKNIHYRDAFEAWYKGFQLGDICCFENAHFILNKNNIKHLLDHSHIESIESNHLMMYEKLIKLIDNFIFG